MSQVQQTFTRIRSNVKGIKGNVVRTTFSQQRKKNSEIASLISMLTKKARSMVRDFDPTNDITFMRIKVKLEEILVAPDKQFILIVMQSHQKQQGGEEN